MSHHEEGYRNTGLVWKIGFCDPAGWTRFVKALTGAVPSRLLLWQPEDWVTMAIEDVFGGGRGAENGQLRRVMSVVW